MTGRGPFWENAAGQDEHPIGWTGELSRSMEPYAVSGMPLNFTVDRSQARVRSTFGEEKLARLVA